MHTQSNYRNTTRTVEMLSESLEGMPKEILNLNFEKQESRWKLY
jgi:hypothetical protein